MPRGAHRICHDALNPRCAKCCPSGRAAHKRRLALELACLWHCKFLYGYVPSAGVPGKQAQPATAAR